MKIQDSCKTQNVYLVAVEFSLLLIFATTDCKMTGACKVELQVLLFVYQCTSSW
jgi:hypothetical protein